MLKPPLPDVPSATAAVPRSRSLALLKPPLPGEEFSEALWARPPLSGPSPSVIEALPDDGQPPRAFPPSVTTTPETGVLRLANRPDNPRQVVLNFDEADIRAVIRVIGGLVGINYVIDPKVRGTVTIQTAGKISVEELLPTLEQILAVNNFALMEVGGLYRIVPAAQARQLPIAARLGRLARAVPADERFIIQIIPVRFIPAATMQEVVKPIVSEAAAMVPITGTNSFILVDAANNVKKVLRVVELLDINTFDRVQTKLYALEHVDPEILAKELDKMFKALGYGDKAAAPLEFIPIPRLNALLVVNGLPDLAPSIELWTQRLDQPILRPEEQTFVYYVQHGDAENIASILTRLFRPRAAVAKVEPSPALVEPPRRRKIIPPKVEEPAESGVSVKAPAAAPPAVAAPPAGEAPAVAAAEEIFLFVVPDTETNALIFRTKPVHYPDVLAVI
ncbi:MAG: hypothetical protein ACE5H5_06995, partial [Nitrospinota bacterium]